MNIIYHNSLRDTIQALIPLFFIILSFQVQIFQELDIIFIESKYQVNEHYYKYESIVKILIELK
jgi:hypothetical protein